MPTNCKPDNEGINCKEYVVYQGAIVSRQLKIVGSQHYQYHGEGCYPFAEKLQQNLSQKPDAGDCDQQASQGNRELLGKGKSISRETKHPGKEMPDEEKGCIHNGKPHRVFHHIVADRAHISLVEAIGGVIGIEDLLKP